MKYVYTLQWYGDKQVGICLMILWLRHLFSEYVIQSIYVTANLPMSH